MCHLREASDLAPKISSINGHLAGLKSIVADTLVASTRLTANNASEVGDEDDEIYNRLLADLTILDDEALKMQEARLEQECANELAKKNEIGVVEDMNSLCNLLNRQQFTK